LVTSILNRQLRPGERLVEQELADLFGVSRTLVREALIQLQVRGFVEVRSRQGWYVVEPSYEDAVETYATRRVLEPGMLRDAGKPLQSVIQTLRTHLLAEREAITHQDAATRSVMLGDFHVCLAQALGNRLMTSIMLDLSTRTTLVSALYQSTTEAQNSNEDHTQIVEALERGNMEEAAVLMRKHIDDLSSRLNQNLATCGTARQRLLTALLSPPQSEVKSTT
jgi:DNA-binding GntR family transcriptional regulator